MATTQQTSADSESTATAHSTEKTGAKSGRRRFSARRRPPATDAGWDGATANGGKVDAFDPSTVRGGHAIAVIGFRSEGRFICRNSWGTDWGDDGFAYVKRSYVEAAFFSEAYGVSL